MTKASWRLQLPMPGNIISHGGETWERAALMKALPIAGDLGIGEDFLKEIEPFVFKKYLDYSTLDEMRSMKKQIEAQLKKKPGLNIKLGQGGIREIEFFVQTLQLINGGKNPGLRSASTLRALELLIEAGHISSDTARDLRDAYLFQKSRAQDPDKPSVAKT